jgi:hypothetical protein
MGDEPIRKEEKKKKMVKRRGTVHSAQKALGLIKFGNHPDFHTMPAHEVKKDVQDLPDLLNGWHITVLSDGHPERDGIVVRTIHRQGKRTMHRILFGNGDEVRASAVHGY